MSIVLSFVAVPVVAALGVAVSIWGRCRYVDFPIWKVLALLIACGALVLAMAEIDPGSFLNWFGD